MDGACWGPEDIATRSCGHSLGEAVFLPVFPALAHWELSCHKQMLDRCSPEGLLFEIMNFLVYEPCVN